MSTTQHDLAQLYQHSDDCTEHQLRIRLVGSVLQHLYTVVDDMTPTGSVEALELRQLARQLDLANETCARIVDVNKEYYLEDVRAAQTLELEGATGPDDDIPF